MSCDWPSGTSFPQFSPAADAGLPAPLLGKGRDKEAPPPFPSHPPRLTRSAQPRESPGSFDWWRVREAVLLIGQASGGGAN